ncbi:MAG TPA: DUF523 domain-containing protein [Campylobacterales bacterium]|nr:DUF523 domain-containing protein [Campylobacterales bacterium]
MKKALLCVWREKLSINSKPKILISACLLGERVRFDGKIKNYNLSALENYELIACCPEVDGGLPTPRLPSEMQLDGNVINSAGIDISYEFNFGANLALNTANFHNIQVAILKSKSPSCSNKMVYDGSFNGVLVEGLGVTAKLLEQNGVKVFDENEIEDALAFLLGL